MSTLDKFDLTTWCSDEAVANYDQQGTDIGICAAYKYIDEAYEKIDGTNSGLDVFYLLFAASMVFFMQAGFAMLEAGTVEQKNSKHVMLKNLLDACGGAIAFWSVGYAFAYGGGDPDKKGFIGNKGFFLADFTTGEELIGWFFQFAFAATAATIVSGAVAGRCKFEAYFGYSFLLTAFVYPVVVYSIWCSSGFISAFNNDPAFGVGMHDFAGSGVVHMTGGICALVAAKVLGPRIGRFYDADGNVLPKPANFPPHSVSLQVLGTFILWFGWYGFNPGSTLLISDSTTAGVAALCAVNTTIAAAAGSMSAIFTETLIEKRKTGDTNYNIVMCMNGALSGLVAITAGCSVVEPWAAFVIGIVSGWTYIFWSNLLVKLKIDDALDAVPVHFGNGIWGCIAVGLFAEPTRTAAAFNEHGHYGWFYSWGNGSADAWLLCAQVCGVLWIIGWVSFTMVPYFLIVNHLGWYRVDALQEQLGLDTSHHHDAKEPSSRPDSKVCQESFATRVQPIPEIPLEETAP